jgi:hypothetical protein
MENEVILEGGAGDGTGTGVREVACPPQRNWGEGLSEHGCEQ